MGSWTNKFDQPTKKGLVAELDKEQRALFEKGYRALTQSSASKPKLLWTDMPWNWCFVYSFPEHTLIDTAYLIADPATPRIALSIRAAFFDQHPLDQLPKELRPQVAAGVLITHQTWCEWRLSSPEILIAITDLIGIAVES